MTQYDRFDIYMKILEVIEKDISITPRQLSTQEHGRVTTIIERLEGTLYLGQEVKVGDNFENISNSVIATRGSIATGLIAVQERGRTGIADAIRALEQAVSAAQIPDGTRQEALELLKEITGQAATEQPSKTVLKSLGSSLGKMLESVGSIADVVGKVWPVISTLWA
jgi:hypothetical protein